LLGLINYRLTKEKKPLGNIKAWNKNKDATSETMLLRHLQK
jgi:hypothetical protein